MCVMRHECSHVIICSYALSIAGCEYVELYVCWFFVCVCLVFQLQYTTRSCRNGDTNINVTHSCICIQYTAKELYFSVCQPREVLVAEPEKMHRSEFALLASSAHSTRPNIALLAQFYPSKYSRKYDDLTNEPLNRKTRACVHKHAHMYIFPCTRLCRAHVLGLNKNPIYYQKRTRACAMCGIFARKCRRLVISRSPAAATTADKTDRSRAVCIFFKCAITSFDLVVWSWWCCLPTAQLL